MKKVQVILAVLLTLCLLLVSCDGTNTSADETKGNTKGDATTKNESSSKEQVLVDNDIAKITFIEIYEEPSLPKTCFVRLKVENKSDKTVRVSITDSYVNDTAQMMGTGMPIVLAPGKNSQQPFTFAYTNLGIETKDEIKKMEFKVWLWDDDTNDTVLETESFVIEFNK